jgi:hypothetical protein
VSDAEFVEDVWVLAGQVGDDDLCPLEFFEDVNNDWPRVEGVVCPSNIKPMILAKTLQELPESLGMRCVEWHRNEDPTPFTVDPRGSDERSRVGRKIEPVDDVI